ncbi:MAG: hydrogenase-4 component G [Desulfobacteraceae bacterium]|nr:MAG: hydrogenase-4 component G [Desulfobacteraceae bacterium]
MIEQSIQSSAYARLQEFSTFSFQTARKYDNATGNETLLLNIRQSTYADFRMETQYRSGKEIYTQTETAELQTTQEFTFAISGNRDSTVSKAQELVGENGYFGVEQTSGRIADFVLSGAGDDIEKLKAGREGVLRGLKEAEDFWGGRLPEISYSTIEQTLKQIDEKIYSLNGSVIDTAV